MQLAKKCPNIFLIIILLLILFLYFIFVKLLILDCQPYSQPTIVIFLVFYNLLFIMLLWGIIEVIRKDPGVVPKMWGFGLNSSKRKYCIICHVFKPERTHHCSVCQRCVLNMDHHCPWINNCIGFYNRKAFILMLMYTVLLSFLGIVGFLCAIPSLLTIIETANTFTIWFRLLIILIGVVLNTIAFCTILMFLKFHLQLILGNLTTLQTLQMKRQGKDPGDSTSQYDIGKYFNWVQVFGRTSWAWPIPSFCQGQGPAGDGVLWPKNTSLHVRDTAII